MNVVNYAPKELPELRCGGIRMIQAAFGAVQCQMMDMTYPGVVPMHKVTNCLSCLLFLFFAPPISINNFIHKMSFTCCHLIFQVNFDANSEYDMIVEYKVLQEVFNKFYFDKNFLPQPPGWSVEALDQDLEQICWKEHLGSKHQELFCLNKKEPLLSS
ncbi:hypothetical protein ACB092_06G081800 [Castanea dentata]